MIIGQAIDHFVEGNDAGRRQYTCLTHAATNNFARSSCPKNKFSIAADHGTDWCPQPLTQAE